MSFISELKRRNVFKVGVAYLVSVWLLIQIADILLDNIGAPPWVLQALFVVLGVGFFVAVFFAWAFELTPEGVKREKYVDRSQSITPQTGKKLNNTILILMALAIAYLLFDKFAGVDHVTTPAEAVTEDGIAGQPVSPQESGPTAKKLSIAVLPFDNRSNREEDQFFTDGIHDDLLTTLAKIGSMKVISRTSVMEYKNTTKKIPEIATELGVGNILEGGIQRSGDQVRINVQLIDAETDEHLWAEIFDRKLTAENLFSIQSEISKAIADALRATLTDQEEQQINRRPTENLAAYNAYMLARQLMPKRTSSALQQARDEFERAVKLDPRFALAWVGIADCAMLLTDYGKLDFDKSLMVMQSAIDRALEIDPQLGEAHASQGSLYDRQNRWSQAENSYRRAIELSPNYATAYHWYANMLAQKPSRLQDALAAIEKANELDPFSTIIRLSRGWALQNLGEFEQAVAVYTNATEMNPDFARAYSSLAFMSRNDLGRFDEAFQWILKSQSIDNGNVAYLIQEFFIAMSTGATELASDSYRRIEELDDKSEWLSGLRAELNIGNNQLAAAREQAAFLSNTSSGSDAQWYSGYVFAVNEDYERALTLMLRSEPAYADRDQWARLIEQDKQDACVVGWIMMNTQDELLGRALISQTVTFLDETLPQYVAHADRYRSAICHAALGNIEASLDALEQQVAHNHIDQWWTIRSWPPMRRILDEPRFIALDQKVSDELARQRVIIEALADQRSAGI
jgi:TolB-like protein